MTTKAEIIKLATNYIKEYADNQAELSSGKTAEVIYDLVLRGTRGQNCPFAGRKIFCLEEQCTGCYWYDRTLELESDHDRTLPATTLADLKDKTVVDGIKDFWLHQANLAK